MPLTYLVAVVFLLSSYELSSSYDVKFNIVRHEIKGRAEIFHNGKWGSICDDNWTDANAEVFCRMHGYRSGVSIINKNTVDGAGNILLDDVTCTGSESSIDNCSHNAWGVNNCGHSEDTGVHCVGQLYRISGKFTRGIAEVYHNGNWGRIADPNWSDNDAKVFCKSLGYTTGKPLKNLSAGHGSIAIVNVKCHGHENNIIECVHSRGSSSSSHKHIVGVHCEQARVRVIEKYIFGRGEVFHKNVWGTICDDGLKTSAAVVFCRSLGYSSGDLVLNTLTEDGTGKIWLDDVNCNGGEKTISDCSHSTFGTHNCHHSEDIGMNCSIAEKRLHNGYAEVFYKGAWGRICDDNWSLQNSFLFCHELGYTLGNKLNQFMPMDSTRAWLRNVQCSGRESYLDECSHSDWNHQTCTSGKHVKLICFKNRYIIDQIKVLLVEGTKGTVNIITNGTKAILTQIISNRIAEALCRSNGFSTGSTISTMQVELTKKELCIDYIETDNDAWFIHRKQCQYGYAAIPRIKCVNEIYRMVGGGNDDGRLEVNINGQWGNLCSGIWNNSGAKLACNALGFHDGVSVAGRNFKSSITKSWVSDVNCTIQSKSLSDCQHILLDHQTCPVAKLIGVKCFNVKARFLSGSDRGAVQVFYDGNWRFISYNHFVYDAGRVICRMLGFTRFETSYSYGGSNVNTFQLKSFDCHGNESVITECTNLQWGMVAANVQYTCVRCSSDIRFHNSRRQVGVIEILHNKEWGGICGRGWTRNDAIVACKTMGYLTGLVYDYEHHLREKGLLSNVNCRGHEDSLMSCPHINWGYYRCNKWAGAECSKFEIRLGGGKSPNEGRVEILHDAVWGTVCDKSWNDEAASVICRSLGYNQGVSYGSWKFGQGRGHIWFDEINCNGDESFIDHCTKTTWTDIMACNHSHDAGVICLEKGVRLVDGNTDTEGTVEIFQTNRWGSLCSDYWSNSNALVICRMLGYMYGSGYQIPKTTGFTSTISPLIIQNPMNCSGNESSIFDCPPVLFTIQCHYPGAQVFCADVGVRFVDKISDNAGAIEVLVKNEWQSICPTSWNENAAFTICNMLGFEDGFALTQLNIPTLPRFITNLNCKGNEYSIDECSYDLGTRQSCSYSYNVGVFCSMVDMRINGTVPDSSHGYLEILYRGIWGSVCNGHWSNTNAAVACRSLGYRFTTINAW